MLDEEQQVKDALKFVDKVLTQNVVNESECIKQVFAFVSAFTKRHKQAETRLPYHVNLIDELHADENAHSRILAKFLQQKTGNSRFEILESLIEYIKEKYPDKTDFRRIVVGSPQITQEEQRIDLWVRDTQNGYAIIIENKVHWAVDQGEQLARYIDVTKDEGFAEHQIFVFYLPSNYDKNPDDQTWGNYKSSFEDRYLKLSFRDDILYWLKEKVLPNVRWIDTFLRSAVEQYIDHLEGLFLFLRCYEKKLYLCQKKDKKKGRKKLERPSIDHLYGKAIEMLVPLQIRESFEMWGAQEYKDRWVIEMREKEGIIPPALCGESDVVMDGYCNPTEVLSHSFVCKPIYLRLYRRRYKRSNKDEHYSNEYDVTLKGVKMVPELGIFLKEES